MDESAVKGKLHCTAVTPAVDCFSEVALEERERRFLRVRLLMAAGIVSMVSGTVEAPLLANGDEGNGC